MRNKSYNLWKPGPIKVLYFHFLILVEKPCEIVMPGLHSRWDSMRWEWECEGYIYLVCHAWFTFSFRVLVETFVEMRTRQSTHEYRHLHSRARIVDNKAKHSRHSRCANVNIHTLVWESSMGQDIWDILVSFDSWLIYWHVPESSGIRREQVKSVENKTNVPFTLSFSFYLMLSQRECKPDIIFLTCSCLVSKLLGTYW